DEQTTVQSERIVAPFKGKWIKVEGDLDDVTEMYGDTVEISFKDLKFTGRYANFKNLAMTFIDKKWIDYIDGLKKGTHLVVQGQISRISKMSIRIENCEIVL